MKKRRYTVSKLREIMQEHQPPLSIADVAKRIPDRTERSVYAFFAEDQKAMGLYVRVCNALGVKP